MLKRPHYIALSLVALLTLILLNLPSHTAARLKLAIGGLFLPLFGLTNSSQQTAKKAADLLVPRGELLKQNETLRRENQRLQVEVAQAQETARENARLRLVFDWRPKSPWKSKLGNVVLRDPANWWRTVQIDLGSRDGMRTNLPVLTAEGFLAGRIASVGLTRSQVILLGDQNCKVSALVENETRDMGVIAAADTFDNSLVTFGYLSKNALLKAGQNVVTSGLGEIFPKGLPIGRIVDARPVEYGLSIEARVKLGANLDALEEVWVLMQ